MRLAISNVAWGREHDHAVAAAMAELGFAGVEIAPTAVWPDPPAVPLPELRDYARVWQAAGIEVVALQALLFGHGELLVFGSAAARAATLERLDGMMRVAAALGARVLVFGSPRNRHTRGLPPAAVHDIAREFFDAAGERATGHGVVLGIEPNPPAYGADFLTDTDAAARFVAELGNPGVRLHLDAGALSLNGERPAQAIAAARPTLCHFHASEPFLAPIGTGPADHAGCAAALREIGYGGWVSGEMRPPEAGDPLAGVVAALRFLAATYGDSA